MPTYEYHCDACEHDFEKFQSMSSDPIKVCPKCGKKKVRRLIGTGAGLIFKGSGFYITDYRDKGYADQAKADNGSDNGSGSGSTEAKPSDAAATKTGGGDAAPKPAADAKPAETKAAAPAKVEAAPKPAAEPKASKSASKKR
jgi:putative FmdB family regulatory protein